MLTKGMDLFMCTAEREMQSANTGWTEKLSTLKRLMPSISPKDRREIRQIIYQHFEYIEEQWDEFQRRPQQ